MSISYKGKILISNPSNFADMFSRSVVLIIDHDHNGAFGLILNRKNDKISKKLLNIGFDIDIYEGGPVANDAIFFVVKSKNHPADAKAINDNFYLSENVESIISDIMDGEIKIEDVKVFSGYSGWGPLQLESEMYNKLWTLTDIFDLDFTAPSDHLLWKKLMENVGGKNLIFANAPENISLN